MKRIFGCLMIVVAAHTALSQANPLITSDTTAQQQWVEAQYGRMTPAERVGQLFMVMASPRQEGEKGELSKLQGLISEYGVGGVIFSRGNPQTQARLTNGRTAP